MEKKPIEAICYDCAQTFKSPYNKGAIGMRGGTCDVCGKSTYVCDAYHDYGIDSNGNVIDENAFKLSNSL